MKVPTLRRCVDVTLATTVLAALSVPITAMIALAKLESGDTGIFRQTRFGLNEEKFTIFKLRTLRADGSPLPVSGFLRKIGADESLQLWNIARGDMSFVGPRPCNRLFDAKGWDHRSKILPGLIEPGTLAAKEECRSVQSPEIITITNGYVDRRLAGQWCLGTDLKVAAKALKLIIARKVDGPNALARNSLANSGELRPG